MEVFHLTQKRPGRVSRFSSDARRYFNRHFHIIFGRAVYVTLFATIQITFFAWLLISANRLTPLFLVLCALLSLLAAVHVINKNNNPAYKIAWLIPMFSMPIFGGLLYLMFGARRVNRRLTDVTEDIREKYSTVCESTRTCETVQTQMPRDAALQSAYIAHASGCLPFGNTQTQYYPTGDTFFPALCEALRSAKRYIFLEYFNFPSTTII